MYADFDTISISAMSNSQPSAPEKGSGAVQGGSPSRPTSESLPGREIRAQGEEDDGSGVEKGERGGGEIRAPGADQEGGLQEEVAESSGAGQEVASTGAVDGRGLDLSGSDDDDGYHTPTSPRCMIPADLPCPPAPRKIPPQRRWRKRNLGDQEIYRIMRRRIQLSAGFELVLRPVADGAPPDGGVDNGAGGEDVVG